MKKIIRLFLFGILLTFCACSVDNVPELDFKPIDHYVYDGALLDFQWDENVAGFWPVEDYKYGFDKNPDGKRKEELDEIVYVTVSKREDLSSFKMFVPKLSRDLYSSYMVMNEVTGDFVPVQNEVESSLPAGKYQLYGVDYNGEKVAINRHIQITALDPLPKKIMYVELNGSGTDDLGYQDGFFTFEKFKDVFSKVYGAAVLEGDFQMKMPEDVGLVSGMNYPVNMMESAGKDLISIIYATAVDKYTASGNNDEHYLHVVIAVNKLKKYWPMKIANDGYSFSLGGEYNPNSEPANVSYFMGVSDDCGGGTTHQVSLKADFSNNLYRAYDENGDVVQVNACNYLFTENGYPVVPNSPTAAAINYPIISSMNTLLGGVAWVPYSNMGYGSLYTMMHELGHGFGLADVITSYTETLYVYDAYGKYVGSVADGSASVESNLMAWKQPTGSKIRLRPQQIVCTGGTKYFKGANTSSKYLGSIETPIPELFDSQIGCLRGMCGYENLNYWNDANRQNYWRFTNQVSSCNNIDVFNNTEAIYQNALQRYMANKEKEILGQN